MAKSRRVSAAEPMPGNQADTLPAWFRRLDRLFHRRNTLMSLMQTLTDEADTLPGSAIARSLIPVFLRTPWPELEVPEEASAQLSILPPLKRAKALQRWKKAFYALVLKDREVRNGGQGPYPFHESMVQSGHPEYIQLLRQKEIEEHLLVLSKAREERLQQALKVESDEVTMDLFFRDHHFQRAKLHIQRLESAHILKAIQTAGSRKPPDTDG